MEEILASIKRVIAEDSPPAGASQRPRRSRRPEAAVDPEARDEDVLELDEPAGEEDGLMSKDAAAASREKLSALSALRDRVDAQPLESPLEAVVREMLRPVLKEWLDEHLPDIVEALVKREIARITGKSL